MICKWAVWRVQPMQQPAVLVQLVQPLRSRGSRAFDGLFDTEAAAVAALQASGLVGPFVVLPVYEVGEHAQDRESEPKG